jgi:RNA polymerase sigma-70 factor, ECF subfamily
LPWRGTLKRKDIMSTPFIDSLNAVNAQASTECVEHPEECVRKHFDLYGKKVVAFLRAVGATPLDATDLMHDTFVDFLRTLEKRVPIVNPRAWIFTVARRRWLKLRKRYRRRPETSLDEAIAADPWLEHAPGGGIDDEMVRQERCAGLRHVLRNLSQVERECVALKAQGLKLHEIGKVIGKDKRRVSEVLARTVAKIRKPLHVRTR